ncbi:MAG: PepSY domain-containing protein [Coleofasciculaceae cyanobacterium]
MSVLIKRYTRQLHRALAPIMLFPLLLTLTTGLLFHIAALNGKETDFLWLLALHRGKFGSINLEIVYVFFNALGLLFLVVTGLMMWFQTGRSSPRRSKK